jgi:serine/threonine-protein kinase ULK/ATG1
MQPFNSADGKYHCTGEIIGQGSFSTVCKGKDCLTGKIVAMKILKADWESRASKNPTLQKQLEQEIKIMKEMKHENIVRLYDEIRHPTLNSLCLVLEYCEAGDFEKYIISKGGSLSERVAKPFFVQLAEGVKYLHISSVIHRDLKPENLLLSIENSKYVLKIADFGLARILDDFEMAQTLCGTKLYMAPEIQKGSQYTDKADLWSVGVIIYRTLTGKRLIQKMPDVHQLSNPDFHIFNPNSPEVQNLTPTCKNLLTGLLQDDPRDRMNWDTFTNHPFLVSSIAKKGKDDNAKKPLFWQQYDSKDVEQLSKIQESAIKKNEEKQKLINTIKKLADDLYKDGKYKEAFVLYVELLSEIKSYLSKIATGQSRNNNGVDSQKVLEVCFDDILTKAKKIRDTIKLDETVKNPVRIILDHVLSKGVIGAECEKEQNWSAATDAYYNALSCLYFLENYLSKNGTVICQNAVFNYTELFKQRHSYTNTKRENGNTPL